MNLRSILKSSFIKSTNSLTWVSAIRQSSSEVLQTMPKVEVKNDDDKVTSTMEKLTNKKIVSVTFQGFKNNLFIYHNQ